MVRKRNLILQILTGLMVLTLAAGCEGSIGKKLLVGVISGIPGDESANTDSSSLTDEQQAGYELGLQKEVKGYSLTQASEGNLNDDVQTAVRKMIEEEGVVAVMGGTTNEASRRAASLVNFFNVPMLIPSADGETVLPSNNMWVFQLNPPSSAYAQYVFGNVLSKVNTSEIAADEDSEVTIRLAIVYEQDTFGESAAVATAHSAMDQKIDIVYYGSYTPGVTDTKEIKTLAEEVKSSEADLVYIVSSDPAEAHTLDTALDAAFGAGLRPVIIGQGNGFTSQEFIDSSNADNIYIIRQALDTTNCPADIDTVQKAQTYAAAYILDAAIESADGNMPRQKLFSSSDQLATRHEKVRDALKELTIVAPCIGKVSFDNNGQNKELNFEIFRVENGEMSPISPQGFRSIIGEIAGRDELIITD